MSFLRRVAGISLRDRVRSSVICEILRVEPLLPHLERSQLMWFGHLVEMPPERLRREVLVACPTGKRPRGRPRARWRITSQNWPGNASGSLRRKLLMFLGRGKFGAPSWSCCPLDPTPDKRLTVDGLMDVTQEFRVRSDNQSWSIRDFHDRSKHGRTIIQ